MKLIVLVSFFISAMTCFSQEEPLVLNGDYAEINVERDNHFIELLSIDSTCNGAVDSILADPDSFNPCVLYVLSNVLFNQGKKDEAMFWFYTGQLRARNDANLCLDKTAGQAVSALNNTFGPNINTYAFEDVEKLKITVQKVIDYVRSHNESYDHRWISLHGMQVFLTDSEGEIEGIIEPENNWEAIKKKTIDDYSAGFEKVMKSRK